MRFHERQQFRQPWFWVLLGATLILMVLILGFGLYQQLVLGRPFGDEPMSDAGLVAVSAGVLMLLAGVFALMWLARLDIEVTDREIVIRFFPFHLRPRVIPLVEIAAAAARQYRPILEYGGWGIRWSFNGMAYNVSGDQGVQLVLRSGKRILIGSQRSKELQEAIQLHS